MDQSDSKAHMSMSMPTHQHAAEPELVGRSVQAGIGLFTGVVVYAAAFGGLFSLTFALVYGRMADLGPRAVSALLASLGFIAVYIVPIIKYPANPPSVGEAETIGARTALYFLMRAAALAAMVGAMMLRRGLLLRSGVWNAFLIAAAAYLLVVIAVGVALPTVSEVPEQFPAVVLWQFRMASAGAQLIMWAAIGLAFGPLAERIVTSRRGIGIKTVVQ
jgi:hypothetical protein